MTERDRPSTERDPPPVRDPRIARLRARVAGHGGRPPPEPVEPPLDPDFAHEVLADLYAYRRKHVAVAFVLWAVFGWAGGHRFYLERPGTGVLMLLTGGGLLFWWIADGWRIRRMVRYHNVQ
ncbi:MAG: NINE protein [Gemmatimonadota bacterium]